MGGARRPPSSTRADEEDGSAGASAPAGAAANNNYTCQHCGRQFATFAGQRLHERRSHRAEFHRSVEEERGKIVKARWDEEEILLMATREAEMARRGEKFFNLALAAVMPGRTVEAVKGQRRTTRYRALVASLLPDAGQPPIPPAARAAAAPSPPPEQLDLPVADPTGTGRPQPTDQDVAYPSGQPTPTERDEANVSPATEPPSDMSARSSASRSPSDIWRDRIREYLTSLGEDSSDAWGKPILMEAQHLVLQESRDDRTKDPQIRALLDTHADAVVRLLKAPPPRRLPRRPPPSPGDKALSRRRQRRVEYARVQELFKADSTRCAKLVLAGHWRYESLTAAPAVSKEDQEAFWGRLFSTPSTPDSRPVDPVRDPQWAMLDPITVEEVSACLKDMFVDSAAGPDQLTVRQLRSWPRSTLARMLNLWLYTSYVPEALKHARTTLIPKAPDASTPDRFRPITVSSVRVRLFSKILARRASQLCPLSPEQRAFIPADGTAENAWLLDAIMRESQQQRQPLAIAWIDVAKAFDSVSHESISRAAARVGMPPPIVDAIRGMYTGSTTEIRRGCVIRTTRGVRQGDPLSPHLFNSVVDEAVRALGESPDGKPTVLAFADDLVVLARTPAMLQHRLEVLTDTLSQAGLSVNPQKCQVVVRLVDGRHKRTYVAASQQVLVNGKALPNVGAVGEVKYLGLQFDHSGIVPATGEEVRRQLGELTHAPLKPEQRMYILRTNIIPGALHTLVLGKCRSTKLKRLDQSIRKSVRAWLHLPPDAPDAYIHAHVRDGGLGVSELAANIPLLRFDRASRILNSSYSPIRELAGGPYFRRLLHESEPVTRNGERLDSKTAIRRHHRGRLLRTVDGRGLGSAAGVPYVNDWVRSRKPPLQGCHYVGAVKVRGNLLYTAQRAARASTDGGRATCDAGCLTAETLAHISQVCHRTAAPRTARHNRVLDLAAKFLKDRGASALIKEPAISTPAGLRRPDLLVKIRDQAAVLDAQVVADNGDLDAADERKRAYYDTPVIREYAGHSLGVQPESVRFGSITLNWRGAFSKASAGLLTQLGLSARQLELLSIRTLEGTHQIYKIFRTSTATSSGSDNRRSCRSNPVRPNARRRPGHL